jgi:hypothetical protein
MYVLVGILQHLYEVVAPIMNQSDDVSIQADLLCMELQAEINRQIDFHSCSTINKTAHHPHSSSPSSTSSSSSFSHVSMKRECLERLLTESKDRIQSLRKCIGDEVSITMTEVRLSCLHQWLLEMTVAAVEEELAHAVLHATRRSLWQLLQRLQQDRMTQTSSSASSSSSAAAASSSALAPPTILIVLDQYESVSESAFADFLQLWRSFASCPSVSSSLSYGQTMTNLLLSTSSSSCTSVLRLGCVLGLTSIWSPCYHRMPLPIASCLHLQPFVLEDSRQCFQDILHTLVVGGACPLTFSGTVLIQLAHVFTASHSMALFLHVLRQLLHYHFTLVPDAFAALLPLPSFRTACRGRTWDPPALETYTFHNRALAPGHPDNAIDTRPPYADDPPENQNQNPNQDRAQDKETSWITITPAAAPEMHLPQQVRAIHARKLAWRALTSCLEVTWNMTRQTSMKTHPSPCAVSLSPSSSSTSIVPLLAAALDGRLRHSSYVTDMQAWSQHGNRYIHFYIYRERSIDQCFILM